MLAKNQLDRLHGMKIDSFYPYPIFFQRKDGNFYNTVAQSEIDRIKDNFDGSQLCYWILEFFTIVGLHGPFKRDAAHSKRTKYEERPGNTINDIADAMIYLLGLIYNGQSCA